MARINLLPWREELRKQKKREFGMAAGGSVVVMIGVVFLAHMHINGLVAHQQSRNQYLKQQISAVEAKIKEIRDLEKQRQQLIDRMRVIEQLQRNRPEVVHLFQELVELTPDGLFLESLEQKDAIITVRGKAQSNARVSSLMRALDKSNWFAKPRLELIEAGPRGAERTRVFTLEFEQATPTDEGE